MPVIRMLDQATINQIAAGEVIERPSSVVKELFENAVDAKASAVTVEIKDGGISLIRVTDNGYGIEKEQIPLAFKRHATSKITDIMDLVTVSSLGFRGEALSSIAAVAQVELITKTADTMLGISYRIEDGEEKGMEEIGAPDGTTFLVKNLFGHIPARRKFLKSAATEGTYIAQLMENMALSRPNLSVRFINNGQNKLYTSGNGRLKDLIYTVYGREISSNLIEIAAEKECFRVNGYIGKPIISRGNRTFENYYINGRFIKSSLIAKAIETAYKPFMMQHRYPFTVLHLEIDSELIDVNVHPAKMELRFRKEEEIYNQLVQVIEEGLRGKQFIPDVRLSEEKEKKAPVEKGAEPFEAMRRAAQQEILPKGGMQKSGGRGQQQIQDKGYIRNDGKAAGLDMVQERSGYRTGMEREGTSGIHKRIGQENRASFLSATVSEVSMQKELPEEKPIQKEGIAEKISTKEQKENTVAVGKTEQLTLNLEEEENEPAKLLSAEARKHHRLIGQIFDTYWLIQYDDKLYIMDQHAAHEKVIYERMLAGYQNKECLSQILSPAMIVSLAPTEEEILKQYLTVLKGMGYEIEPYGGKEYAITAVPANLYGINEKELFIDLLAQLEISGNEKASELIAHKLATMSCKAAIKGNQHITFQEADALIEQLLTLNNPYACPHGRPTLISMSRYELEKKFKRIV